MAAALGNIPELASDVQQASQAVRRDPEGGDLPTAKRQKVFSAASQAAMAAIAATARLPTQVNEAVYRFWCQHACEGLQLQIAPHCC